jgi:hypothetical protein
MLHGLRILGSVFTFAGVAATAVPLAPGHGVAPRDAVGDRTARAHDGANDVAPFGAQAVIAAEATTAQSCTPAEQCCRICSKGKACGNSCIRQSYTCHKGRGCACNADEVCE